MSYVRFSVSSGKMTVVPVASIDFVIQDATGVVVYLTSGRTLKIDDAAGTEVIDAVCAALDASAHPKDVPS